MNLRVLMVMDRFPQEPFLAHQVAALRRRSVDVHVLCQIEDRSSELWSIFDGIDMTGTVHSWPERGRFVSLTAAAVGTSVRAAAADIAGLRSAFRTERLAGQLPVAEQRSLLGRLLFDARVLAIQPDVVHFQFGDLARHRVHLAAAVDSAFSASFRGYDLSYAGLDEPGFYDTLWPALDGAHTLGEDLRRRAIERGCPPDVEWQLISPALDPADFDAPDRSARGPSPAEPVKIVSVARLHWKKGLTDGLLAVGRLVAAGHRLTYRIVGDGPAAEQLRWTIDDLGLREVVELVGHRDGAGVIEELTAADLCLHPSLTEGFGNAVLEAQVMGLPVVCTDAEGLAENVVHGETGIVVPRHNPQRLADALAELIADRPRRLRLGRQARQRVEQRFDQHDQTEAFIRFFKDAVERRAARDRAGT